MSCQSLPMWQYFTKKEWQEYKRLIDQKLDLYEKLTWVPPEKLTDPQFKKIKELEIEINTMYSMKNMLFKLHESYLESTQSITGGYLKLWTENELNKRKIVKLEQRGNKKDNLIYRLFSMLGMVPKSKSTHE